LIYAIVLALIILFDLAAISLGISAIALYRQLNKNSPPLAENPMNKEETLE